MKSLRFITSIGLILASINLFSSDENLRNKSYRDNIGDVISYLKNKESDRRQTLYDQSMVSVQTKACFCVALLLTPVSWKHVVTVPMQPQICDMFKTPVEKFMEQNVHEIRLEKPLDQKSYKKKFVKIPSHR